MTDFNSGDKVKWIQEMTCVPHPEGKTDRNGEVLPVFRDKERTGVIVHSCYDDRFTVRPDDTTNPKGMESYYDRTVKGSKLTKIN
jgi:hypothetical protein|tara:strand:+ start:1545 stop:1799 length:255 start_codon:yes stop_codon:yes gene_type:complete